MPPELTGSVEEAANDSNDSPLLKLVKIVKSSRMHQGHLHSLAPATVAQEVVLAAAIQVAVAKANALEGDAEDAVDVEGAPDVVVAPVAALEGAEDEGAEEEGADSVDVLVDAVHSAPNKVISNLNFQMAVKVHLLDRKRCR